MTTENEAPAVALSPELAALAGEAAANDTAQTAAANDGAGQPVVEDTLEGWRDALGLIFKGIRLRKPALAKIYTDEKVEELAQAVDAVARKYNFTALDFFTKWGPEIALAMCGGGLLMDTAAVLKAEQGAEASTAGNGGAAVIAAPPPPPAGPVLKPNTGAP